MILKRYDHLKFSIPLVNGVLNALNTLKNVKNGSFFEIHHFFWKQNRFLEKKLFFLIFFFFWDFFFWCSIPVQFPMFNSRLGFNSRPLNTFKNGKNGSFFEINHFFWKQNRFLGFFFFFWVFFFFFFFFFFLV